MEPSEAKWVPPPPKVLKRRANSLEEPVEEEAEAAEAAEGERLEVITLGTIDGGEERCLNWYMS